MRRARHFARSILSVAFAISLCAALALSPKAEAVIRLGDPNTVSLSNGLVGYWPLDGQTTDWATGQTKDLSGNGYHGSLALMATSSSPVIGKIGQAMNFEGVYDRYISMGNVLHQNGAFTYSAWIYQTNQRPPDSAPTIMSRYLSSNWETWFGIGPNGTPLELEVFSTDGTSWIGRDYTGSLSPYTWYHVVASYDGGTATSSIKLYVNGKRGDSADIGDGTFVSPRNAAVPFSVGAVGDGFYPFAGRIDDVRVYNRALSATEVKQLYNLGTAKIGHSNIAISNGLVGYWTFDGQDVNSATGKARDISGSGFDGQLQNFSTSTSPSVGKAGQAMGFNGSESFVDNGDVLRLTSGNFSFAAWTFVSSSTQQFFIFHGLGCSNWTSYYLSIGGIEDEDTGKYGFGFGTADAPADNRVASTMNAITGRWVHLVGAYNGSALSLYVDGQLNNSAAASGNPWNSSNHLYFGADPGCGGARYVINGKMDDVRIYNRALSATEVKQLYKSVAVTVGHSNAVISNGLVGYWTFDGPSIDWHTNTVSDMSGNGNTGTLISMSTTSSPTPGKIGQALKFNGSTQSLNMGTGLHLNAFTYSAWIYMTSYSSQGSTIMGIYRDNGGETWFGVNSDNGTEFQLDVYGSPSTDWIAMDYSGTLALNKWYHAVATYDGGATPQSIKIYLNGVNVGDAQYSVGSFTTPANTGDPFKIGGTADNNYYFAGKIDDVRIYNRALSAAEIKQLYNAGR